jgi:hypothetical protein
MPIAIRDDFDTTALRRRRRSRRTGSRVPAFDAGCDLRGIDMHGVGQDRRRHASDVRDGCSSSTLIHSGSSRARRGRRRGDGRLPCSACGHDRRRPDPGRSWRRAPAARRPLPMGVRRIYGSHRAWRKSRARRASARRKRSGSPTMRVPTARRLRRLVRAPCLSNLVVVFAPILQLFVGVGKGQEPRRVQAFGLRQQVHQIAI